MFAGTADDTKTVKSAPESILDDLTPLNTFDVETSYVGTSSFKQKEFRTPSLNAPGGRQTDFGDTDEVENSISYGHRFHLFNKLYLKLGVDYERFDFAETTAPLPSTLSSINGVVNLEYIVKGHVAAFINTKPGVYYGNSKISLGSVDVPTSIGTIFPVPYLSNVYGLIGARFSILSHYPALPIGGLVWIINDSFRLQAVPPEPRFVYTVNKQLDLFIGGEILGEAYKRNSDDDARPQFQRFSKGIVSYSEERVGGGLTYSPIKAIDIDVVGGWALERNFEYYRGASKSFITHGAPYAKVSVSAQF